MAQIVSHNPASVHAPSSGYSMGLELFQHRRLLFISGQVPEEPDGSVPDGFEVSGAVLLVPPAASHGLALEFVEQETI